MCYVKSDKIPATLKYTGKTVRENKNFKPHKFGFVSHNIRTMNIREEVYFKIITNNEVLST